MKQLKYHYHVNQRIKGLKVVEILDPATCVFECMWLHDGVPCGNRFRLKNYRSLTKSSCGCLVNQKGTYLPSMEDVMIKEMDYLRFTEQWIRRFTKGDSIQLERANHAGYLAYEKY